MKDHRHQEQALESLGIIFENLGNYQRAIDCYEQRLAVAQTIQDTRLEQQVIACIRTACYAIGDYSRANRYQRSRA
ncbi:tetratricopeptide repeat protein [Egbenema bharatensis]|uniref:tetratricopeptide repeat protein n=1 Tax=Egbenema bharatensis TaxID=3463334 RepID=UPI003A86490A